MGASFLASNTTAVPTQTQVLGALDAVVGDDDVVVNAAGSLPGDLHRLWRARSPRQYHVEYGYSCMGYEIPAALGVKLAAPDRPVWALVGDGTYLMMPTEIVTAVRQSFFNELNGEAITVFSAEGCRDLADLMGHYHNYVSFMQRETEEMMERWREHRKALPAAAPAAER